MKVYRVDARIRLENNGFPKERIICDRHRCEIESVLIHPRLEFRVPASTMTDRIEKLNRRDLAQFPIRYIVDVETADANLVKPQRHRMELINITTVNHDATHLIMQN